MANPRADRSAASVVPARPTKTPVRRSDTAAPRAEGKPTAISRANEIVRAIGLRPITGLSGPKIGY
ncbi:hypothetical protein E4L95_10280 [Paracoccus liaowanqingii]|uniref:Uncharacterized protein n=1 Tax=Paracoccus liaowanqingii TaxID=2560053 RepID=A0A4Z1CHC3_9RHOB|nr:hypothetical protein [Paracoccus liaowanqingii]TGN60976.1 hypothetical protein E4L95_10280 [Paracoccus liaowanqingii]